MTPLWSFFLFLISTTSEKHTVQINNSTSATTSKAVTAISNALLNLLFSYTLRSTALLLLYSCGFNTYFKELVDLRQWVTLGDISKEGEMASTG